ncbi:bestrophin family protein [Enhygromyxa salina]|uniref:Bestrophin, RFP-TM, chloride channel n=1 Tax=Enhygromyxa salina TaxID=215803 RepID=A0A2S9YWV9_9BACT|nr:bestrophin family ion channel [Enhygromyxa salina]PRQ09591.1 Bestrophin, RFP-TM, chloride channel [Enhygromyxa salina]
MFVDFRGSIWGLLRWQWKASLVFALASSLIVGFEHVFADHAHHIFLPVAPVAVVGGAIGIFVSFRTNSAYARWWEGRQLWGRMINSSRHFCTQVLSYLPNPEHGADQQPPVPSELQRALIRRHIAYVHALRVLLRNESLVDDTDFNAFLPGKEAERTIAESNPTHALLHTQMRLLVAESDAGRLDPLRLQSFDETIRALLDIQGGCERIQKTPFPRSYGFIADRLIMAYGILLPLGLVGQISNDWIAIPLTLLVCLSFALINEVGRVLEDPFTTFWPSLPLSALAKTIEINLRQRLGDANLPESPKQDARGILM